MRPSASLITESFSRVTSRSSIVASLRPTLRLRLPFEHHARGARIFGASWRAAKALDALRQRIVAQDIRIARVDCLERSVRLQSGVREVVLARDILRE